MAVGSHLSSINPAFLTDEERWKKMEITDIPVMLSHRGEIVCIPKESEVFSCAIVGSSGKGKSLIANRLVGSLYHQWGYNVAVMNDLSEETYKWSEPMKRGQFNEFNDTYIHQPPVESPITYVFPNTTSIKVPDFVKKKSYVKIVLPFNEILDNLGFYLGGVCPDFDLGKSGMYVNELKEELLECDSPTQVKEVLEELLPSEKGFKAMGIKIRTAFNALIKEEILDITNPECHAYLKLREEGYISNPFSVLMKAKAIPSFITSDLRTKKYKSEVFAYYINAILKNHLREFPGEKTFLFFDELREVCERDDNPAARAIGSVAARGRINNVGLIYATQFYDKIPPYVKGAKLNYCFAFAHNSSKILNELASDFDLDKKTKERIKRLKTFEVIAMTNNKFVCYFDGDRYETTKPIRGTIFYPLADHLQAN
ncbi:MAG: hypothetical protein KKB31_05885 [Nanoarchaeota archaeon]|nr:hypothetical protein [Nanoarchaeota archaeon]